MDDIIQPQKKEKPQRNISIQYGRIMSLAKSNNL